jgi:hypothetical protein
MPCSGNKIKVGIEFKEDKKMNNKKIIAREVLVSTIGVIILGKLSSLLLNKCFP